MKSRILQKLRKSRGVLSGEALSRELGISRVAVWKHIQKLRTCGYQIESGPKGYRLTAPADTPFPWEFPEREPYIHFFPEVNSTMDVARDIARQGGPDFSVVVADKQASGRGRMERRWESPAGGLYFTMVLRPNIPVTQSPLVNFAASLVLARTIQDRYRLAAKVKWPNDVLIDDRKVSGMLSEMETQSELVSFINIGIGININNAAPQNIPAAASIRALTGRRHNRAAFLADYLDRLEDRLHQQPLNTVIDEWKTCTATLGRPVKIVTHKGESHGMAEDVDDTGALMLRTPDGSLTKIFYGDCFHTP